MRYFEQRTQFGAVVDMVMDRCTTSGPVEWCSRQTRSPDGALSFKIGLAWTLPANIYKIMLQCQ